MVRLTHERTDVYVIETENNTITLDRDQLLGLGQMINTMFLTQDIDPDYIEELEGKIDSMKGDY